MLKFLLKTRNPSTANANEAVDVEDAVIETVWPATTSAEKRDDMNSKSDRATERRNRKFNPSRKKAFPWVKVVNNKMFCDVCMKSRYAGQI